MLLTRIRAASLIGDSQLPQCIALPCWGRQPPESLPESQKAACQFCQNDRWNKEKQHTPPLSAASECSHWEIQRPACSLKVIGSKSILLYRTEQMAGIANILKHSLQTSSSMAVTLGLSVWKHAVRLLTLVSVTAHPRHGLKICQDWQPKYLTKTSYLVKKFCVLQVFSTLHHIRRWLTHCHRHGNGLSDILADYPLGQLEEAWHWWLFFQLQV